MKEEFQYYIYTEKVLADLYRKAAALATAQDERDALLTFSQAATKNAEYLNYLYRQEYGTNFDPMIPDTVIQGNYRSVIDEITKQEIASFLKYRKNTIYQDNVDVKETMLYISDVKLGHILSLLGILTRLNAPES
ncbi:MAG: hypothetical protein RR558_02205 [Coprobacillus sp.]